jgi:hypothetical protein
MAQVMICLKKSNPDTLIPNYVSPSLPLTTKSYCLRPLPTNPEQSNLLRQIGEESRAPIWCKQHVLRGAKFRFAASLSQSARTIFSVMDYTTWGFGLQIREMFHLLLGPQHVIGLVS